MQLGQKLSNASGKFRPSPELTHERVCDLYRFALTWHANLRLLFRIMIEIGDECHQDDMAVV